MTKPRKQRLRRIEQATDLLFGAIIELKKRDISTHEVDQELARSLCYLYALARKAK